MKTFPSKQTRFGPFSVDLISTVCIIERFKGFYSTEKKRGSGSSQCGRARRKEGEVRFVVGSLQLAGGVLLKVAHHLFKLFFGDFSLGVSFADDVVGLVLVSPVSSS